MHWGEDFELVEATRRRSIDGFVPARALGGGSSRVTPRPTGPHSDERQH